MSTVPLEISDLIIGVGLRFDDRVTGKVSEFAPHARFIHIDIDPSEMHKVKRAAVPIVADAKVALARLIEAVEPGDHSTWINEVRSWEAENNERSASIQRNQEYPDPTSILEAIRAETNDEAIIVTDVGQHQMWTARHYTWTRPNSHITSGGLGTMGFALPAAMGVKMGMPDATVWVVAGDGGIQMNIQELATLKQEGITVKVAIMNNGYLGMVRQWQHFFHNGNYSETPITGPDYVKLADAYGLTGMCVTRREDVEAAVHKAMETEGTVIIDFVIESEANVYPMVAPGAAITNMIEEKPRRARIMTDQTYQAVADQQAGTISSCRVTTFSPGLRLNDRSVRCSSGTDRSYTIVVLRMTGMERSTALSACFVAGAPKRKRLPLGEVNFQDDAYHGRDE